MQQFRGASQGRLFIRVFLFAAAAPALMRLRLPALKRLLERRFAAGATTGGHRDRPADIIRCVESAIAVGTPIIRRGCLTRGLTLYYFLRRAGMDLDLCFGARARNGVLVEEPGHCWLVKDGQPFLEQGPVPSGFVPIYSLAGPGPKTAGNV